MITRIRHLLELIRFSHTIFALPFALLAALMAWRLGTVVPVPLEPDGIPTAIDGGVAARLFVGILLCMIFARSAAMAFNRITDWRQDAQNPRTAGRHIPRGALSVGQVTTFFLVCSIGFVASTTLFLPNRLPLLLSVPVLAFICGYSYAKRFTVLVHFWLGAALMLSPICAWIAIRGEAVLANPLDGLPAALLGSAVMLWVAGFDMLYACQDVAFDRQAGLHSIPARLGVKNALRLAALCHLGTVLLLASLPWFYPLFGGIYWTGIGAASLLLLYEHWLVRPEDLNRVNVAFFHVNAVVSMGLLVVGALDLLT